MAPFAGVRRALNRRRAEGPLAELYATPVERNRWLAVDVETTGLDPATDRLLSIGWVPVDGSDILLGGAGHVILRDDDGAASVGDSAALHGITDDAAAAGEEPREALARLLTALRGRRLLAHHAALETGFLDVACRRWFGAGFDVPVADTMAREYHRIGMEGRDPVRDELRLWTVRARYGLPRTRAHHALNDALACAELWLAQDSRRIPRSYG
ncbi:3'-5' exonuclease [Corynebacterium sp. 335C]